jgi:uncharacterized membrane protein
MTKSVRWLIIIIGALSLLSGIYLAFTGAAFPKYFSGIFIGAVLIGTLYFSKKELDI